MIKAAVQKTVETVDRKTSKLKGWRFFLCGLLVAISGPALFYFETLRTQLATCATDTVTSVQVCSLPPWTSIALGIVIWGLRAVTTSPMFKKY